MKFILFLLLLFLIGCIFYGIAIGVQSVAQGAAKFAGGQASKDDAPRFAATPVMPSQQHNYLHELQELHRLYQKGVLSREEFVQFKQYLLSTIYLATHAGKESA